MADTQAHARKLILVDRVGIGLVGLAAILSLLWILFGETAGGGFRVSDGAVFVGMFRALLVPAAIVWLVLRIADFVVTGRIRYGT